MLQLYFKEKPYSLLASGFYVGSGVNNHLVIEDTSVPQVLMVYFCLADQWHLAPLDTSAKLYLNGALVTGATQIKPGDTIYFDDYGLHVGDSSNGAGQAATAASLQAANPTFALSKVLENADAKADAKNVEHFHLPAQGTFNLNQIVPELDRDATAKAISLILEDEELWLLPSDAVSVNGSEQPGCRLYGGDEIQWAEQRWQVLGPSQKGNTACKKRLVVADDVHSAACEQKTQTQSLSDMDAFRNRLDAWFGEGQLKFAVDSAVEAGLEQRVGPMNAIQGEDQAQSDHAQIQGSAPNDAFSDKVSGAGMLHPTAVDGQDSQMMQSQTGAASTGTHSSFENTNFFGRVGTHYSVPQQSEAKLNAKKSNHAVVFRPNSLAKRLWAKYFKSWFSLGPGLLIVLVCFSLWAMSL